MLYCGAYVLRRNELVNELPVQKDHVVNSLPSKWLRFMLSDWSNIADGGTRGGC